MNLQQAYDLLVAYVTDGTVDNYRVDEVDELLAQEEKGDDAEYEAHLAMLELAKDEKFPEAVRRALRVEGSQRSEMEQP